MKRAIFLIFLALSVDGLAHDTECIPPVPAWTGANPCRYARPPCPYDLRSIYYDLEYAHQKQDEKAMERARWRLESYYSRKAIERE